MQTEEKPTKNMLKIFEEKTEKSESSETNKEEYQNKEESSDLPEKINRNLRWYERIGLKDDPFDHRNLSPRILGHDDEKQQLIEWIKEGRSVLLYGPTGVGKTNIIKELMQEIRENKIEGLGKTGIMNHAFDTAEPLEHIKSYKKAKGLFGLGKRRVVALMDEIHFAEDKDVIAVSAMWDNKKIHSSVFVQINPKPKMDQLMRRIGIYKIQLNQISKSTIIDIIKQRTENKKIFEQDALEALIKLGGENPSIVLQLCGEVASFMADPKKSITLKDIKEFRFSDLRGMSKEALRDVKLLDTLNDKARKRARCSPYEWEIVKNLRTGHMIAKDLAKDLDKKPAQVTSVLNRMIKKGQVEIKNTERPKHYGLEDKFEREFVLING